VCARQIETRRAARVNFDPTAERAAVCRPAKGGGLCGGASGRERVARGGRVTELENNAALPRRRYRHTIVVRRARA